MTSNKGSQFEPSDASALAPVTMTTPQKTATSYNNPGMPTPPAGYGSKLGFEPNVPGSIGC